MNLYEDLVSKFVTNISGTERHTFSGFTYENANGKGKVFPRLMEVGDKGGWCFYDKRQGKLDWYIRIDDFVRRFARNEIIGVGGYLEDGKVSSITFERSNLLKTTKEFEDIVNQIKNEAAGAKAPIGDDYAGKPAEQTDATEMDSSAGNGKDEGQRGKITLADLEKRLARQREIGDQGEAAAFRHEYLRLHELGCANPADCIVDETKKNVGAGYDLRSEFRGVIRCIEVKASVVSTDSFFISEHEKKTLTKLGESAYLYLVLVDREDPKNSRVIKEIPNPFGGNQLALEPVAYWAKLSE